MAVPNAYVEFPLLIMEIKFEIHVAICAKELYFLKENAMLMVTK